MPIQKTKEHVGFILYVYQDIKSSFGYTST